MHELMELKEKLVKELEDYAQNGKYSKEDVETIKYMASAVDHLCNIISEADETGYSNRDGNMNQGGNRSYARGRGRYARRDSMGRYLTGRMYSRTDGIEELVDNVREMMQDLPPDVQQDAQKFVRKLEQEMA